MSWTYDDPSSSLADAVRFLIGDNVEGEDPTLSDEEIEFMLAECGNAVYSAAVECAEALAAKFARKATSKSVGDLSLSYGSRATEMRAVADRLRATANRRGGAMAAPWAAPANLSRAPSTTDNGTEFRTGQMDNPGGPYGDLP